MSHASRFCISQALVTLLLLPFSPTILTATDNPVPLPPLSQPSDDRNQEHGFFFAWPDMVRRDSCAAPSSVTSPVPAAYLNSCWQDYRFSGQAGSADTMSHASRFCISEALVTLLLLPFSPTILTATDNPGPLPPLSQPSDDRNQEHGFFFAWPGMVRRDCCAAPSSATSPVPAAYLNSCWHDYRFSGQAGSADTMSYASRFCISEALVTLLLLPFSPTILTATDNPGPLPPLSQPSDDRNQEHGFFFAWPDMVRRDSCAAPSSVTSPVPAAYLNSCWQDYRFSGQAGSADTMSRASRFCISEALVTLLLLPFSPTILTATDNPGPLPPLSQPSDDRNQEHGFFFAWPGMDFGGSNFEVTFRNKVAVDRFSADSATIMVKGTDIRFEHQGLRTVSVRVYEYSADACDKVLSRALKVYGKVQNISNDNLTGLRITTGNRRARMELRSPVHISDVDGHVVRCEYDGADLHLCRKCRLPGHER
ncbi:hypothetical protein MRX96_038866 [Rhipicephalus microplus]